MTDLSEETFKEVIERLRSSRKLSRTQIAQAAGVNRSRVTEWLNGKSVASPLALQRLSLAYGLDLDRLMTMCRHRVGSRLISEDPELEEHVARFQGAIRNVPREFWQAVVEASIRLAESMPTPSGPVTGHPSRRVTDPKGAANSPKHLPKDELPNCQHSRRMPVLAFAGA